MKDLIYKALIQAARTHGQDSEPDMEIGDLQDSEPDMEIGDLQDALGEALALLPENKLGELVDNLSSQDNFLDIFNDMKAEAGV